MKVTSRERRLLQYESTLHEWRERFRDDYLQDPLTAVGGAASLVFELPDTLLDKIGRSVDGTKAAVEPLTGQLARTRRNVKMIFQSGNGIGTRILSLIRTPGDLALDGLDAVVGAKHVYRSAA